MNFQAFHGSASPGSVRQPDAGPRHVPTAHALTHHTPCLLRPCHLQRLPGAPGSCPAQGSCCRPVSVAVHAAAAHAASSARLQEPWGAPLLQQGWPGLHQTVTRQGARLGSDAALAALRAAVSLASQQHASSSLPTEQQRLQCLAVVTVCSLALLRNMDVLGIDKAAEALTCFGQLVALGVLRESGPHLPHELLVACAQLMHHARMAAAAGMLTPDQLAGVLRCCAVLTPQYLTPDWLAEVEQQLAEPGALQQLSPAGMAALLGTFTFVRRARLRQWYPSRAWVATLQAAITPRLHTFNGCELATTVYGLVDLTTPSNPCTSSPATSSSSSGDSSDADAAPDSNSGIAVGNGGQVIDRDLLLAVHQRVQRIHRRQAGGAAEQQPGLQPRLLQELRQWEEAHWAWQQQQVGAGNGRAHVGQAAASTKPHTAHLHAHDNNVVWAAGAGGRGRLHAMPVEALLATCAESATTLPRTAAASHAAASTTAMLSLRTVTAAATHAAPATVAAGVAGELAARDLALLLVGYTRLGLPGFTPCRPARLGTLPLQVLQAYQELAGQGVWRTEDDE